MCRKYVEERSSELEWTRVKAIVNSRIQGNSTLSICSTNFFDQILYFIKQNIEFLYLITLNNLLYINEGAEEQAGQVTQGDSWGQ